MNNCYGKSGDMQMPLVCIYPDIGDVFYIKCCVSDTDDTESIRSEVASWIEVNMKNISHFELVFGTQHIPENTRLFFTEDFDGNEFEIYLPKNFAKDNNKNLHDWIVNYFTDDCASSEKYHVKC